MSSYFSLLHKVAHTTKLTVLAEIALEALLARACVSPDSVHARATVETRDTGTFIYVLKKNDKIDRNPNKSIFYLLYFIYHHW